MHDYQSLRPVVMICHAGGVTETDTQTDSCDRLQLSKMS